MGKPAWVIRTPAQIQLVGPSQSGKSTFLKKLLEEDDNIFDVAFSQIWYASPYAESQDTVFTDELRTICASRNRRLFTSENVPNVEEVRDQYPEGAVLLILDDLLSFEKLDHLVDLSSIHAHHRNISCLYALQNPFQQTKKVDLLTVSRNLTGRIIFDSRNDMSVFRTLNSRIFPERRHFIIQCLKEAKKLGYPYIFLNTHPQSELERRYICYTGILSREKSGNGGSPYFFDLERGS